MSKFLNNTSSKSVSLVLGSGGARGLAHIGVIHWLQEHGYRIESIAGSSMGALVGGVFALGKLEEFSAWVCAINKVEILRLMDFSFSNAGVVKGDKIINVLKNLTGDSLIEALPIRFTAVATDLANEKEVWIAKGTLFDAIRASIAMPLFFSPVDYYGCQLLDGGILNPVPIAPTFSDNTDITVAVNLAGATEPDYVLPVQATTQLKKTNKTAFNQTIDRFIDSLTPTKSIANMTAFYQVANQSIDAMQATIARQKLAAYPPDFLVELPRNLCGTLEFDRAEAIIAAGYAAAAKQLQHLTVN